MAVQAGMRPGLPGVAPCPRLRQAGMAQTPGGQTLEPSMPKVGRQAGGRQQVLRQGLERRSTTGTSDCMNILTQAVEAGRQGRSSLPCLLPNPNLPPGSYQNSPPRLLPETQTGKADQRLFSLWAGQTIQTGTQCHDLLLADRAATFMSWLDRLGQRRAIQAGRGLRQFHWARLPLADVHATKAAVPCLPERRRRQTHCACPAYLGLEGGGSCSGGWACHHPLQDLFLFPTCLPPC